MSANALALQAARQLQTRLLQLFPDRIVELRLFGSMARGDAHEDSDIDVLVLVDRRDSTLWRSVVEASHFADLGRRELLFAQEVQRDGVVL